MYQISQVTDQAKQSQQLVLPDGTLISLQLYYAESQGGWFVISLTYGTFTLQGVRLTTSPNLLRQWKNLIPFGLCCSTQDDQEATQLQSFSSGYAKLYVLSAAEVLAYETFLSGGG